MTTTNDASMDTMEFFILALLPDHFAPLSIVLPQVLLLTQPDVTAFFRALRRLESMALIIIWEEDPDSRKWAPTEDDYQTIIAQYQSGERAPLVILQILDDTDLWLQMTAAGRTAYFADPRAPALNDR